jgi:crotonobetainyl-CoA:carnitine CoA-transferase CaiB-like acyl-CoA transferase
MSSPESSPSSASGQLAGVRVVDLTTVVMGPLATRMLADMGADVIKVESEGGDLLRSYPPQRSELMSGMTLNIDRNKRSIVLDLKDDEDHAVVLKLIGTADVLITNMRHSSLQRLGLSYDEVAGIKPDIVYCVANGYDSTGPWADRPAYDDVIQAVSGLAQMMSWNNDGVPAFVPSIMADKVCAMQVVSAVLASLYKRATTGEGDEIEVSMAETMVAFNLVEHLNGHTFEPPLAEFSYHRVRARNRKPRSTADGWIAMLPYSNQNWRDLFGLAGRPALIDDPRFSTRPARVTNANELYGILNELTPTRTTADWLEYCAEHQIPAAPVTDLANLRDDPYFSQVDMLRDEVHPTEGPYKVVRDGMRSKHSPQQLRRHAPKLGEHNAEIRAELDELS